MNKELNEAMKNKNSALFRKVVKKNDINSDEYMSHKYEKKCILDEAVVVTSFGVLAIGIISKFSNETMCLMAPEIALGVIGGSLRFIKNATTAGEYQLGLSDKREELYNIENDLNNADKQVKKLTR